MAIVNSAAQQVNTAVGPMSRLPRETEQRELMLDRWAGTIAILRTSKAGSEKQTDACEYLTKFARLVL